MKYAKTLLSSDLKEGKDSDVFLYPTNLSHALSLPPPDVESQSYKPLGKTLQNYDKTGAKINKQRQRSFTQFRIKERLRKRVNELIHLETHQDKELFIVESKSKTKKKTEYYLLIEEKTGLKRKHYAKITVKTLDILEAKRDKANKYMRVKSLKTLGEILGFELIESVRSGDCVYVSRLVAFINGQEIAGLEVHHLDKNPLNNRPDNLVSLRPNQHEDIHTDLFKQGKILDKEEFSEKNMTRREQGKIIIKRNRKGALNLLDYKRQKERELREDIKNICSVRLLFLMKGFEGITHVQIGKEERLAEEYDKRLLKALEGWHGVKVANQDRRGILGQIRGRIGDYYRMRGWEYDKKSETWKKKIEESQLKLNLP